jgi:hypothetical protein
MIRRFVAVSLGAALLMLPLTWNSVAADASPAATKLSCRITLESAPDTTDASGNIMENWVVTCRHVTAP